MSHHQITVVFKSNGLETYTHGHRSVTDAQDGFRKLLRLMVSDGLTGPAEIRGDSGELRFSVDDIERFSRWSLRDNHRSGLRLIRFVQYTGDPWSRAQTA